MCLCSNSALPNGWITSSICSQVLQRPANNLIIWLTPGLDRGCPAPVLPALDVSLRQRSWFKWFKITPQHVKVLQRSSIEPSFDSGMLIQGKNWNIQDAGAWRLTLDITGLDQNMFMCEWRLHSSWELRFLTARRFKSWSLSAILWVGLCSGSVVQCSEAIPHAEDADNFVNISTFYFSQEDFHRQIKTFIH